MPGQPVLMVEQQEMAIVVGVCEKKTAQSIGVGINAQIFPAGVVDQTAAVNGAENDVLYAVQ